MTPLAERFWSKVQKADGAACWEWIAGRFSTGYGQFSIRSRPVKASRFAYELAVGPIPAGLCVLHRCDNRACCNPDHLFLGTLLDNSRDRDAKGRTAKGDALGHLKRGELNARARLTTGQVGEIRRAYRDDGATQQDLAAHYRMSKQTISAIVRGERWRV